MLLALTALVVGIFTPAGPARISGAPDDEFALAAAEGN
jgi:hypothetical protein